VRRWHLIDADGMVLGRLAVLAAGLIRGKGKATFSPSVDQGDAVVVVNAGKVVITGRKDVQKTDFRASGYRGGQKFTQYGKLLQEKPERAVELAVSGMLPKNRLRSRFMRRLKVFRDESGLKQYPGAAALDVKNARLRRGGPAAVRAA
jgi:large subunit ribosomal protein L13